MSSDYDFEGIPVPIDDTIEVTTSIGKCYTSGDALHGFKHYYAQRDGYVLHAVISSDGFNLVNKLFPYHLNDTEMDEITPIEFVEKLNVALRSFYE